MPGKTYEIFKRIYCFYKTPPGTVIMLPEKRRLGRLKDEQVEITLRLLWNYERFLLGCIFPSSRQITRVLRCLSENVNEFQVLIIYKLPFNFLPEALNSRWDRGK